ncbi:MAG: hypothetical protein QXX20_06045 [Candidatus Thermoplasmatota archaeon]
MKNMKKATYIVAITLVIAGLMITSGISIPTTNVEQTTDDCIATTAMFKTISKARPEQNMIHRDDSVIIFDTETDDFHPAVAGNAQGRFFTCFEANLNGDYYPWFLYSIDGSTWEEAGYFAESLGGSYPDIDSNDNGFYATFAPPSGSSGEIWVVGGSDPSQPEGMVWDFGPHGIEDFRFNTIASYTRQGEDWNFGCVALTGYNNYQGANVPGTPFILYPYSSDGGIISWLQAGGFIHSDVALDEVTQMCYAVYDHETTFKLKVRKSNFGTWQNQGSYQVHPSVWSKDIGDGTTHLQNMSIEAYNNSVLVVAESAGDIICLYSTNGGTSFSQSTVVTGAQYPDIILTPDGNFVCSYVKENVLYTKITSDSGATWEDETKVADNEIQAEYRASNLGKGQTNVYAVWQDNRAEDLDIYFAAAGPEIEIPILDVVIQKGMGIGAKATVTNVGTGPATNVAWSIKVTGGILGRINKEVTGTVIAMGISETAVMNTGMILGLGAISVVASATCTEGANDQATASGTQILFLTKVN